jgi:gamma-glutamylcyclotransferase (GGCT)/AIG2-like uncharacterized protein YtfP
MPLMFLNGGAMRGGELHHLLHGAPLVGVVRTAPKYRFHSVGDRFPALEPGGDTSVAGELYDVPWEILRESLLPSEPDELELGVIELDDGNGALAMVRRHSYREPDGAYRDISAFGDWHAYRTTLERP